MRFTSSSRTSPGLRALALCLVLALLAAACGSSDPESASADTETTTDASATAVDTPDVDTPDVDAPDADAPDAGDADPEGSLTVAFHLNLNTLDPLLNTNAQNVTYNFPTYDSLIHRTGEGALEPRLASSWQWSDDGLQLIMNLEEGVMFHDGSTLDADVVKANIDRLIEMETSPVKSAVAYIDNVEVIDPLTVAINMTAPDASLLYQLADRAGMIVSGEALASGVDLETTAVGAGPYRLVEFSPSDRISYERFDDYWGDPAEAGVRNLEIIGISDGQARLNGLQTGEFDAAYITPSQAGQVESAGIDLVTNPSLWFIQLYLNYERSEFGDVRVREALAHALDQNAICTAIYFGYCEPTSQPFFVDSPFGIPEIGPTFYEYDPDRARELLADAGLEDGFEFEAMIPAGSDPYPQLAELMQAQFAAIGVTMNLNPVDISQLATSYFIDQNSDALLGGGGQQADPGLLLASAYAPTAFANPGGGAPDGLEDLIAEIQAALDPDERAALVREAFSLIVEDVENLTMFRPQIIWGVNDNVLNWNKNFVTNNPDVRGVAVTGD